MPRPYELLDSVATDEGALELRQRGERDFMISVGGRVLMTSAFTTSELALANLGCQSIATRPKPRVLIGGLGLGFTLRAALDALPSDAHVFVAELNPCVVKWCQGPVAAVNGSAALDQRVTVITGDVMDEVRRAASNLKTPRFDAILWDLYVGPTRQGGGQHPLYGDKATRAVAAALGVNGVFGVWSETPSPAYEQRLNQCGMSPQLVRTTGAGLRHAVILASKR